MIVSCPHCQHSASTGAPLSDLVYFLSFGHSCGFLQVQGVLIDMASIILMPDKSGRKDRQWHNAVQFEGTVSQPESGRMIWPGKDPTFAQLCRCCRLLQGEDVYQLCGCLPRVMFTSRPIISRGRRGRGWITANLFRGETPPLQSAATDRGAPAF